MIRELGKVEKVVKQEGDNVLLSVPMLGFPSGFQLRPGDKVTLLINEDGQLNVKPLVHFKRTENFPESREKLLDIDEQKLVIQENTILDRTNEQARNTEVFIVDSDSEEPEQIIAVRSRN